MMNLNDNFHLENGLEFEKVWPFPSVFAGALAKNGEVLIGPLMQQVEEGRW